MNGDMREIDESIFSNIAGFHTAFSCGTSTLKYIFSARLHFVTYTYFYCKYGLVHTIKPYGRIQFLKKVDIPLRSDKLENLFFKNTNTTKNLFSTMATINDDFSMKNSS